jgi:hypothetical protein
MSDERRASEAPLTRSRRRSERQPNIPPPNTPAARTPIRSTQPALGDRLADIPPWDDDETTDTSTITSRTILSPPGHDSTFSDPAPTITTPPRATTTVPLSSPPPNPYARDAVPQQLQEITRLVGEAHQLVDSASMDAAVQAAIRRAPIDEAQWTAIEARLTASVNTAVQLAVDAAVAHLKAYLADHLDQLVSDRFDTLVGDSLNILMKDEVALAVDPYRLDMQEAHDNNLTAFDRPPRQARQA